MSRGKTFCGQEHTQGDRLELALLLRSMLPVLLGMHQLRRPLHVHLLRLATQQCHWCPGLLLRQRRAAPANDKQRHDVLLLHAAAAACRRGLPLLRAAGQVLLRQRVRRRCSLCVDSVTYVTLVSMHAEKGADALGPAHHHGVANRHHPTSINPSSKMMQT